MADVETSQVYCDNDDDTVSDLSSSPSIPDGEIDFNFVYALHTFLATVEGQATSQKGDTLVLLDDSNSYWWLVKNIKDESIGYLPAEHIETPPERLARLNKHRNVDNGASQMIDLVVTPKPTTGLSSKFSLRKTRKPATKQVAFSSPKFIEYEVFESEDDDNDNEDGAIQGARQSKEVEAVIARESVLKSDQRLGDREYNQEQDREKTESTHPQDPDVVRVGTAGARTNDSSSAERHLRHGEASLQAGAHLHKDSHSSFQSEAGSSVTTADDGEVKESKKKKGVFSGLFKKRSKREKSDPDSVSRITSATSQEERPAEESKDSGLNDHASHLTSETETHSQTLRAQPVDLDSGVLELPAAVKEMRSSVLMNTDPVTVDMVEEPHHRGPVDEVEMLLAHRNKTPVEIRDPEQQVVPKTETFVWTDRAIEAYLKNEKDVHKQLIVIVAQQAKSERLRNRPSDNLHVYGAVESSIDSMLKELDGLLLQ